MSNSSLKFLFAFLALTLFCFSATTALAVSTPIGGVTVLETSSDESAIRNGPKTVDQSGCAGCDVNGGGHGNSVDNTMWNSNHGSDPQQPHGRQAHIVFDLGNVYDVEEFRVWNWNDPQFGLNAQRSIKDVTISVSSTDTMLGVAASIPSGAGISTLTTNQFAVAPGTAGYTGELFVESFTARYVRIDALTNYSGGDLATGLSEIAFGGEVFVPEPSSFVLAAFGLAGLGWFGIRRRKG